MNIKKVSEQTGVTADTIRYYERIGLIPPVSRKENGIRNFTEEDIKWLIFARQMRNAGISIEALIEYLSLFREGANTVDARIGLLNNQKDELQSKIDTMQEALDRLNYKINNYHSHVMTTEKKLDTLKEED